jgi:hypothetical protein
MGLVINKLDKPFKRFFSVILFVALLVVFGSCLVPDGLFKVEITYPSWEDLPSSISDESGITALVDTRCISSLGVDSESFLRDLRIIDNEDDPKGLETATHLDSIVDRIFPPTHKRFFDPDDLVKTRKALTRERHCSGETCTTVISNSLFEKVLKNCGEVKTQYKKRFIQKKTVWNIDRNIDKNSQVFLVALAATLIAFCLSFFYDSSVKIYKVTFGRLIHWIRNG